MLQKKTVLTALLLSLAGLISSANAGSDQHDHHHDEKAEDHSLEAHVHGQAELLIAQDQNEFQLEFRSPAANIVGFEHKPKSEEEKASVTQAQDVLENATALFQFNGSQCSLTEQSIDFGYLVESDGEHEYHADDHEDDHHHHDGHDKGHDDEPDEDHKSSDHAAESHTDIEAEYQFSCDNAQDVTGLVIKLLSEFADIEELGVQWIVQGRQGAYNLDKTQNEVVFE